MNPGKLYAIAGAIVLALLAIGAAGALPNRPLSLPARSVQAAQLETASPATLAATSSVTSTISYQGRLTNAGGGPVNGNRNMRFIIYDDPAAGAALWDSGAFCCAGAAWPIQRAAGRRPDHFQRAGTVAEHPGCRRDTLAATGDPARFVCVELAARRGHHGRFDLRRGRCACGLRTGHGIGHLSRTPTAARASSATVRRPTAYGAPATMAGAATSRVRTDTASASPPRARPTGTMARTSTPTAATASMRRAPETWACAAKQAT